MANQRRMNRRTRRRRSGSNSETQTSFLGKLLIMLAVVAAIVLGVAIFFQVNEVQVQGNLLYSAEQIEAASGVEAGDNLLMVNRAAVVGSVQAQLPYVQTVSVGRILPDTVVIKVHESEIAGLVEAEVGSKWYVNTAGRILGSSVDGLQGQIVELTGFTVKNPVAGEQAVASPDMEENMKAALMVLEEMEGSGLIERVTAINAEKSFDIHLLCGEQYDILLGGSDKLDYKVWYLQGVLEQLQPYQAGVIDLTFQQEGAARFQPWAEEEKPETTETPAEDQNPDAVE